jgi:hypothetical protein
MKNIKINGFLINSTDILSTFEYINVRFDGCPNIQNKNILSKLDQTTDVSQTASNQKQSRVDVIYEGKSRFAFDVSFKPFTEYFYRVTASDPFGKSAVSDWFLLRTPEAEPNDYVDLKYLNANVISGYQISVRNISNYCFYCDSNNRKTRVFNGIINNFVLVVKEFSNLTKNFVNLKNVTFYCETVCFQSLVATNSKNYPEGLFQAEFDPNANELFIETKPITKYSLAVKICNSIGGCTLSDFLQLTTNEEGNFKTLF